MGNSRAGAELSAPPGVLAVATAADAPELPPPEFGHMPPGAVFMTKAIS